MVIHTRCCNDEEKAWILDQARKVADERQRIDVSLALAKEAISSTESDWDPNTRPGKEYVSLALAKEAISSTESDWDPNTRPGKESLRHLVTCLLQGMTQGVWKINYNKIKEVTQEENENPALFLSRLTEAFKNFTETDLKSMEGRVL